MADSSSKKACCICDGSGVADSGGCYPWGEWIGVPCECVDNADWVQVGEDEGVPVYQKVAVDAIPEAMRNKGNAGK